MSSLQSLNPRADLLRRELAFRANAAAATGLQDIMSSNLGPKGTLKMLVGGAGQIKVTKDGNVLLKEMHIQHPTASIIARAATAQDVVTGDGSTTTVLQVGEILKLAEHWLDEGVHSRKLAEGLELGQAAALQFLTRFAREARAPAQNREQLLAVARTALRTKLERSLAEQLSSIVVDAVLCLVGNENADQARAIPLDLFMVEVLPMKSGLQSETRFIRGMVMDHGCRHQDMPASLEDVYTLVCNVSLEYEKTEVNSGFFYSSAEQRQRLAEAERRFTDSKVRKIIELKQRVCRDSKRGFAVFNQKGIDPPALEALAREGIMALRRVKRRNMERLTLCCGGQPVNSVEDLQPSDLGHADRVWEITMGEDKYTFVEGVADPRSCCILVRAPTDHEIEQIKDAVRDGLRALRNLITAEALVPGAGSFELACSQYLHDYSRTVTGKAQLGVRLLAEALLVTPKSLCKNAGLDSQDTLLLCQQKFLALCKDQSLDFRQGLPAANVNIPDIGIDLETGQPICPSAAGIWDNVIVKKQSLILSITLAAQLLLVDEIIKAGKQMGKQQ